MANQPITKSVRLLIRPIDHCPAIISLHKTMNLLSSGAILPSHGRHMLQRIVKPFLAQRFSSTKLKVVCVSFISQFAVQPVQSCPIPFFLPKFSTFLRLRLLLVERVRASLLSHLDIHCLPSFQVFRHLNGVAFFSSEFQAVRVFAGKIFKRHDTHSYQIASVNSLKALRNHRLDALDRKHREEELLVKRKRILKNKMTF